MYSIGETAELTGFTADTLRYYEKIGLLPRATRKSNGLRVYSKDDVHLLKFLYCLKQTGLPLEEMGEFIQEGQVFENEFSPTEQNYLSINKRIQILSKHLKKMEEQRRNIDTVINLTVKKLHFYEELVEKK
nr:MerR family transcriptional regulator [Priestia megaterium]MDH3183564.1 MerR family transcriptional regulator [Priestia megaterium]MDH3183604.1 MerR family transcriptional regulator [Priestia megaterium]